MVADFQKVFTALREILKRHAGKLVVTEDTASCFRLEGGAHTTHTKPFPIASVPWGRSTRVFITWGSMLVQTCSRACQKG
jgi:hypothetical protein